MAKKEKDEEVKVKKKAAAKKPRKKAKKILFKAPEDFKPAFFEIMFETLKDGLIRGTTFSIVRVKGKWDKPENKRFDLSEYDPGTRLAVAARLSSVTFAPNPEKRLPGKSKFGLVIRVSKKAADGSLAVSIKGIKRVVVKNDKSKWKWFEDKKDPLYRKIRKAARILPSAFVDVQLPPKGRRSKNAETDED